MIEEGRGGVYFLIKIKPTLLNSKTLLIFIQHKSTQES